MAIVDAIQSQGALLWLREDLLVVRATQTLAGLLGCTAANALGRPLHEVLGHTASQAVARYAGRGASATPMTLDWVGPARRPLALRAHWSGPLIGLEIEPAPRLDGAASPGAAAQAVLATLGHATNRDVLCAAAAEELRALTGYDRVVIYRFDSNGCGEIVAEAYDPAIAPHDCTVGPQYAASSAPHDDVRLIGDAGAPLVDVLPHAPSNAGPPDMARCTLRRPSAAEISHLAAMDAVASFEVALSQPAGPWGCVVGYHRSPRWLGLEQRAALDIIGQVMAARLQNLDASEFEWRRLAMTKILRALDHKLTASATLFDALSGSEAELLRLVDATGAVILASGRLQATGRLPPLPDAMRAWNTLAEAASGRLLALDDIGLRYPALAGCTQAGSGALFLPLSTTADDAILWFRPSLQAAMPWGSHGREPCLQPVSGHAAPWREVDLLLARELRRIVQAAATEQLNKTLVAANALLVDSEAATREAEARLRFAAQAGGLGVWELDLRRNELTASAMCKANFGRPTDDPFTYNDMLASFDADSRARMRTAVSEAVATGADCAIECRIVRADGTPGWVKIRAQVSRDGDGAPLYMAGFSLDVTERVLTQERIQQSQRIEAVGRLTAGVAHDFNNVLQVLLGGLELARQAAQDRPDVAAELDMALQAGERGARLTSHLLSFSRQQVLRPVPLDLGSLLDGLCGTLKRTLGPAITIHATVASGLPYVMADAAHLDAALLNVALNARDAMPQGGELWFNAALGADQVVITVMDTGEGMAPDTLAHACEPFFSTKGVEGSGLGLSMVQGFAQQSGGALRIHSGPAQGTRVELLLPVAPDSAVTPLASRAEPVRGTGRILVVDDDPTVTMVIKAFLSQAGFDVTTARDGHEALAKLSQEAPFAAMVTDYIMPHMNGADLVLWAREIYPALPTVMITGYAGAEDLDALPSNVAILRKPCRRDDLVSKVKRLVSEAAYAL